MLKVYFIHLLRAVMKDNKETEMEKSHKNPKMSEYPFAERKWVFLVVVLVVLALGGFFFLGTL